MPMIPTAAFGRWAPPVASCGGSAGNSRGGPSSFWPRRSSDHGKRCNHESGVGQPAWVSYYTINAAFQASGCGLWHVLNPVHIGGRSPSRMPPQAGRVSVNAVARPTMRGDYACAAITRIDAARTLTPPGWPLTATGRPIAQRAKTAPSGGTSSTASRRRRLHRPTKRPIENRSTTRGGTRGTREVHTPAQHRHEFLMGTHR